MVYKIIYQLVEFSFNGLATHYGIYLSVCHYSLKYNLYFRPAIFRAPARHGIFLLGITPDISQDTNAVLLQL